MNYLLPLIVLILLSVLFAASLNSAKTRLFVVIAILVFVLVLCWFQMQNRDIPYLQNLRNMIGVEGFQASGYAPLDYKLRLQNGMPGAVGAAGCDGYNYMDVNSQISPMGTYDGIVLPRKFDTVPLMNNIFITSPVGDDIKLTQDPASRNFPTVDGLPGSDKHLFVFANNNYGGGCHSQYSTDRGQVCISEEQMKMFMGRGRNLTSPQEYPNM
jgi:hypothetical protein